MDEARAREVMGPLEALTRVALKRRYRELARVAHPDAGGTDEAFHALQGAFNTLWGLASDDEAPQRETVDGTPLADLGRGYPISEAARTCEDCGGHGYRSVSETVSEVPQECPTCGGTRAFAYPCRDCGGTGRFRSRRDGRDVGECHRCKGTGRYVPQAKKEHTTWFERMSGRVVPHPVWQGSYAYPCRTCNGYGQVMVPAGRRTYLLRCTSCKGVGEIKMWNPVLPRGYLASGGR